MPRAAQHAAAVYYPLWGGRARLLVADPSQVDAARREVDRTAAEAERACGAYRDDSDLAALNRADGAPVRVGALCYGLLAAALDAARRTGGLADPAPRTPGAWRRVELLGDRTVRVPVGTRLDVGALGTAYAAGLAAARAARAAGCGVLVDLAGDVAAAGEVPEGGWPVRAARDHRPYPDGAPPPGQDVTLDAPGGLATAGLAVRARTVGGAALTHVLDPRSGRPVRGPWRTVSVVAGTCVDAAAAGVAALVRGVGAPAWLAGQGLPARLVDRSGFVTCVAGWPDDPAWPGVRVAGAHR
ncbi:FAD:protein FMN transferase [Actinomadura parmotrematis]|uniref:FAD:protein FMN transferase n=1 Tax=Actinomadura parmotrematis TaxID=2864039 RepID=A0ABS7FRU2_9ACTN|nr:FAD:protein FMN transferase [Actinomadura parmotrematis]MBW8483118.1 FAD:protein FMN transferase [Actinomadura parmotrematis]